MEGGQEGLNSSHLEKNQGIPLQSVSPGLKFCSVEMGSSSPLASLAFGKPEMEYVMLFIAVS